MDTAVKGTHAEFAAAFEGSEKEKNPGRAQFFLADGQEFNPELASKVNGFLPTEVGLVTSSHVDEKLIDTQQLAWMTRPSVFGFGPSMVYCGLEFMSTGCVRVQVDGARRVAIIGYDDLSALYAQQANKKAEDVSADLVLKWWKGQHPKARGGQQILRLVHGEPFHGSQAIDSDIGFAKLKFQNCVCFSAGWPSAALRPSVPRTGLPQPQAPRSCTTQWSPQAMFCGPRQALWWLRPLTKACVGGVCACLQSPRLDATRWRFCTAILRKPTVPGDICRPCWRQRPQTSLN